MRKPHWPNPWEGYVVYVPIEELAECAYGISKVHCVFGKDNSDFIMTKEMMLELHGDPVDAYILPHAAGYHSIGIRYGAKDSEYLSPLGDQKKVDDLLRKYRKMFVVYDNDRRADCKNHKVNASWDNCAFPTRNEAIAYARKWLGSWDCIPYDWDGSRMSYGGGGDFIEIRSE